MTTVCFRLRILSAPNRRKSTLPSASRIRSAVPPTRAWFKIFVHASLSRCLPSSTSHGPVDVRVCPSQNSRDVYAVPINIGSQWRLQPPPPPLALVHQPITSLRPLRSSKQFRVHKEGGPGLGWPPKSLGKTRVSATLTVLTTTTALRTTTKSPRPCSCHGSWSVRQNLDSHTPGGSVLERNGRCPSVA